MDKRTDAYKALSYRFSFFSKFGHDTPNIDDLRRAAQNLLLAILTILIKVCSVASWSILTNFLRLRVNNKEQDSRTKHLDIAEKKPTSLWSSAERGKEGHFSLGKFKASEKYT